MGVTAAKPALPDHWRKALCGRCSCGYLLAGHREAGASGDRSPRVLAAPLQRVRLGPASGRRGLCGGGAGPPGMVGPRAQCSFHLPIGRARLCASEPGTTASTRQRVGLMGFSAGGLATLLSAADNPAPGIWVGLDPVDHDGMGAKAAHLVKCHAVVLTSQPSACNGHGNASQHYRRPDPYANTSVSLGDPRRRRVANRPDSRNHLWPLARRETPLEFRWRGARPCARGSAIPARGYDPGPGEIGDYEHIS